MKTVDYKSGEIKRIEHDKDLDLVTAYLKTKIENPLKTIPGPFDGHVLFEIDSKTSELVKIVIYDFRVISVHLMKELTFLMTRNAVKKWLGTLIEAFKAGKAATQPFYAHERQAG